MLHVMSGLSVISQHLIKQSTITTKSYKVAHIKRNIDKDILVENMNADVIQDLINSLKDGLSHKLVKDDLSIIKNILRYAQKKYNITDISYIDDVVMPKKRLQEKKLKLNVKII